LLLQHLKDNSLLDFWRNFEEDSPDEFGNRRARIEPMDNTV
jgi:hypothetical protein